MTELTKNQHKTSEQHVDFGCSRMKRDNEDLEKLKVWLKRNNPFIEQEPSLKSISTGLTASEANQINCDDAENVGKAIQKQLHEISFLKAKIKRKDQVCTLECLKAGVQVGNEKIHVDPMLLFSRLLVLVERAEDMRECFEYELTSTPKSLFENELIRKPNKSALGRALKQNVSSVEPPDPSFYVSDAGALIHKMKWLSRSTFETIISVYVKYVGAKYGSSSIVFDGYDNGPYIKDHEHKRRMGKISANVAVTLNNKPTCDQETFLKNSKNKSQFILLLAMALKKEGHDICQSIGDADTQIVAAALEFATKDETRSVTVAANDTDILVLLMFHWESNMNIFMLSDAGKKQSECWNIANLVSSAIYGQGTSFSFPLLLL